MCICTSHITVAAVTEQPMFSSFRKTLFCLLYAADEVRIACFSRFFVYGATYRIIFGWCFLVWSSFRNTEAITASGIVFRTYETHKFSGFLPKNGHSIWCISRTWFTVFEELTRLNDCSVFSLPTSDNESCSGRKTICFLVRPSDFRSYCFFIWTLSFICSRFGYILPAYPTLILRRQEQKQRDKK